MELYQQTGIVIVMSPNFFYPIQIYYEIKDGSGTGRKVRIYALHVPKEGEHERRTHCFCVG